MLLYVLFEATFQEQDKSRKKEHIDMLNVDLREYSADLLVLPMQICGSETNLFLAMPQV